MGFIIGQHFSFRQIFGARQTHLRWYLADPCTAIYGQDDCFTRCNRLRFGVCWTGLTFGPITLGGWAMSAAWLIFIVVSLVFFNDPLNKQEKQEAAASKQGNGKQQEDRSVEPLAFAVPCLQATHGCRRCSPSTGMLGSQYEPISGPAQVINWELHMVVA